MGDLENRINDVVDQIMEYVDDVFDINLDEFMDEVEEDDDIDLEEIYEEAEEAYEDLVDDLDDEDGIIGWE